MKKKITYATIRENLQSIPVMWYGKEFYIKNENLIFKSVQPDEKDGDFYNTKITHGKKSYWCNSIDLEFYTHPEIAQLTQSFQELNKCL